MRKNGITCIFRQSANNLESMGWIIKNEAGIFLVPRPGDIEAGLRVLARMIWFGEFIVDEKLLIASAFMGG